ncbi:MAG: glucose-6-phosphate isomerase, partial [Steroidobacteraceae bacterium]
MSISFLPGPRTALWGELATHAAQLSAVPVRELFARDPERFERFSREGAGMLMDFSRQRLDETAFAKLIA